MGFFFCITDTRSPSDAPGQVHTDMIPSAPGRMGSRSLSWAPWAGECGQGVPMRKGWVLGLGWQWGPGGELPMSIRVSADESEGASKFGGG